MSHRIKRSIRLKTQKYEQKSANLNSPFQSSISAILIDKCDKCTLQLQKDNLKVAGELLASIDKDLPLLHPSHTDYARLMSLIYNAKAGFHRKIGQNQQALKYIQQAICIQKSGNVDRIDMARTLLNKSVLMGQMARQDKNLYSHQSAISLAKQALQIIKNRPQGKQFVHKDQYKLGQIIIISFHNIATELICLKNQKQGYNLYKKAYDLALRVLGPRHNLTIHLKNILNRYKQQKKQSKRIMTQQDSQSPSRSNLMVTSQMNKSVKKTNFIAENKKFKNFFKIYGYSKDHSVYQTTKGPEQVQMKDLTKLQKMYRPSGTHSYFPELKRKNIREIINQGRTQGQKRPLILSVGERVRQNQNQKQKISKFNSSKENSGKRLQKLKTEQIVITSPTQKLLDSKLGLQESKVSKNQAQQETNPKVQEGGCQLI